MNALALLALVIPAAATDDGSPQPWFTVGPLLSMSRRQEDTAWGVGLESTLNVAMHNNSMRSFRSGAVGVFAQGQWMDGNHARLCGGVQGTFLLFGLETGVAHETGTTAHRPTTSLHLSPFLGFVYGSVGVRFSLPFQDGRDASGRLPYGREIGLTLTLKKPFSPML
ncbi:MULTISPECIES: hypothetical protein [unclassified Corallococcus]|uniref:hypothetical protein n=1 Tax=unclassified Corallococcus TaxID=2685029 RepID=UPI001A8ED768|nr:MULTISPECIES: hypothetical protein [unclassified Corallococcus]MBN9685931.1 hypothetical protein [Corallococcus sp. NCSPR001]WAS82629.1 hypothetical protein O0N60_25275 [Corallococcus sp. NCRR]